MKKVVVVLFIVFVSANGAKSQSLLEGGPEDQVVKAHYMLLQTNNSNKPWINYHGVGGAPVGVR